MNRIGHKGVTLIEALVWALILAVGIVGLIPLVVKSMHKNSYSESIGAANTLAQRRVDSLMQVNNYGPLPYWSSEDSVAGEFSVYTQVDDNSVNGTVPAGLHRINVRVTWADEELGNRTVHYSALKPKR